MIPPDITMISHDTIQRPVRAHPKIFSICKALNWSYSSIFVEGYESRMARYLKSGSVIPKNQLDFAVSNIDEQIKSLQELRALLTSNHNPDTIDLRFVLSGIFEKTEGESYMSAITARENNRKDITPVITEFITDACSRMNGEGDQVKTLLSGCDEITIRNLIVDISRGVV